MSNTNQLKASLRAPTTESRNKNKRYNSAPKSIFKSRPNNVWVILLTEALILINGEKYTQLDRNDSEPEFLSTISE